METTAPIVVGIDGSTNSYAAVSWAAKEARLHDCPLKIVTALGAPAPYGDGVQLPQSYFADRDRAAHSHLAEALAIARTVLPDRGAADSTEAATEVRNGSARPQLIEASKSARMMVFGSRGFGQITAVLAGSVTSALAAHAHCPVAVLRGRAGQTSGRGEVVVGIDGSDNSRPALAAAFEEAALRGADLVAVHTWSPFTLSTAFDDQLDLPWDAVEVAEQAVLAESLAGWSERYPEVRVNRIVAKGTSADELRDRSEEAELLVVGSHGRGGFSGMLIGSTSTALLHSARCPLLIVRSRPGSNQSGTD
ncbi:universal stress protein [Rhodococcus sp. ABRD24]|uniref:universal stress protein n=1 Tax=Rhodococcus sp. ABRD24 TaxID=2507582 RepID=UPI001038A297|nr:universal stress protein [Rhodococcus sp. ABRD24]QBJ94619.1 universal stress protein [Rhodococcus sp. ABRD24]